MSQQWQNPSRKDFLLILLALVFPFVTVAIKDGVCSLSFIVSLILTAAFHIPAIVYAIWVVLSDPEPRRPRASDVEHGHGCHGAHCHQGGSGSHGAPHSYQAINNEWPADRQYPGQSPAAPLVPHDTHQGGHQGGHHKATHKATHKSSHGQAGPSAGSSAGPSDGTEPPKYSDIAPEFASLDNKVQRD